jgi:hypothetical protein
MQKKKIIFITTGLAMLALILVASPSLAATINSRFGKGFAGRPGMHGINFVKPAAAGKITAINGNILTIAGKNNAALTIDATNAKITSGFRASSTTIAIGNLTVGEMISATGALTGTNVVATVISVFNNPGIKKPMQAPRVMGKVTAVNGSSFTVQVTNRIREPQKSATTTVFTVNTSAATIFTKDGKTAVLADVATGETVMVAGTVDTLKNVTATSVNITTKITPPQKNKGHFAPPSKTKTTLLGKFLNFFKGKAKMK